VDQALTRQPSVVQEFAKEASPPLVLMTGPPMDPMTREGIGNQIWTGILLRFEGTLSERGKNLWRNPPADPRQSPEHLRVMHMFDDFLLCQIGEQGPVLFMCVGTLQRLFVWMKHSPELLKRLGDELEHHSLVLLGKEKARLPEDLDKFVDRTIPELERLLRMQRDHFGPSAGASCRDVADWMKGQLQSRPKEFPSLCGNLAQLCGWIETLAARNPVAGRRVRRGTMGAGPFFYLWYADCSKRSLKAVKNEISARRRTRH
jgi:hypothetical protein